MKHEEDITISKRLVVTGGRRFGRQLMNKIVLINSGVFRAPGKTELGESAVKYILSRGYEIIVFDPNESVMTVPPGEWKILSGPEILTLEQALKAEQEKTRAGVVIDEFESLHLNEPATDAEKLIADIRNTDFDNLPKNRKDRRGKTNQFDHREYKSKKQRRKI